MGFPGYSLILRTRPIIYHYRYIDKPQAGGLIIDGVSRPWDLRKSISGKDFWSVVSFS
jgi:hypothetical protein